MAQSKGAFAETSMLIGLSNGNRILRQRPMATLESYNSKGICLLACFAWTVAGLTYKNKKVSANCLFQNIFSLRVNFV